jgi:hypothetical protein
MTDVMLEATELLRVAERERDRMRDERDEQRARANRLAAVVRWFNRGGLGLAPLSLEPGDLGDGQ